MRLTHTSIFPSYLTVLLFENISLHFMYRKTDYNNIRISNNTYNQNIKSHFLKKKDQNVLDDHFLERLLKQFLIQFLYKFFVQFSYFYT